MLTGRKYFYWAGGRGGRPKTRKPPNVKTTGRLFASLQREPSVVPTTSQDRLMEKPSRSADHTPGSGWRALCEMNRWVGKQPGASLQQLALDVVSVNQP